MNGKQFLLGLGLCAMASAAVAGPSAKAPTCTLKIENAWVRAAPPASMQLAGYALLKNDCPMVATLTSVTSQDFAMAMVHETVIENGVSRMRHVDSLAVPANGSAIIAPGGLHLMLMNPTRELQPGDVTTLKFALADGSEVTAEFPVLRDAPATAK
jgi:copper(I)-binding protein